MFIIRDVQLETVCGITSTLPDNPLPEIAFAGKSNVGKSSLLNGLVSRKSLARTSAQPGKTRTINYYHVDGFEKDEGTDVKSDTGVYLVDLPGYGYAKASEEIRAQWGKLIEKYLKQSRQLQQVFLLVDIRHEPGPNDRQMYEWIVYYGIPLTLIEWITYQGYEPVIIATKLDKIKRSQLSKQMSLIRKGLGMKPGGVLIPFSAETKQGREDIWDKIMEACRTEVPEVESGE